MMHRFRLIAGCLITMALFACSDQDLTNGNEPPEQSGDPAPVTDPSPTTDPAPVQQASTKIDSYMIYYSGLNEQVISQAKEYDLVIVHPFEGDITATQIDRIQAGRDESDAVDDVKVLCYISIGEDSRTFALSDEQMRNDPEQRFTTGQSGPVVDPRGPLASGESLRNIDPIGIPSPGGTGFAPYYLDDNDYDGSPDRNGNFDVAFVNAGHPAWFDVVNNMTFHSDGIPGLREMLTDDTNENRRGLGCDGVFLDTLDTAAPNSFTDETSQNQSEFEWTAPGFTQFIQRLRDAYPNKLILQNRGLFFFNPVYKQYEFNPRSLIDFVLFESYRLDSSPAQSFDPYFSADNKHVFRPRLMSEAQRRDGFTVLSLGYAEGPADEMNTETLLDPGNTAGTGYASLIQDITETEQHSGFRHYLTDELIVMVNDFVRLNAQTTDSKAPSWSSTFNDSGTVFPTPPGEPTSRVGIQQAIPGPAAGEVTVQWDVALDYNPIQYLLYYQDTPFDFTADPDLNNATQVALEGKAPADYIGGPSATNFSNEMVITELEELTQYFFLIRAKDSAGNEDQNQLTLSAAPLDTTKQHTISIDGQFSDWNQVPVAHADPADAQNTEGPDWREIRIANDDQNLFIYVAFETSYVLNQHFNIYLDTDVNPTTGYLSGNLSGLGADFLVQASNLYAMQTGTAFATTPVVSLQSSNPAGVKIVELAIPLAQLGLTNEGQTIGLTLINDAPESDFAPDLGAPLIVDLVSTPPPD